MTTIQLTSISFNISSLEKSMSEIDWKNAFDFDVEKRWNAEVSQGFYFSEGQAGISIDEAIISK